MPWQLPWQPKPGVKAKIVKPLSPGKDYEREKCCIGKRKVLAGRLEGKYWIYKRPGKYWICKLLGFGRGMLKGKGLALILAFRPFSVRHSHFICRLPVGGKKDHGILSERACLVSSVAPAAGHSFF
jgi:hypothetical protein